VSDQAHGFPEGAVAIVGMAGRFPGAQGLDEFWKCVRDGIEVLETITDAQLDAAGVSAADRADPQFVRRATALDGAFEFDAAFFGLTPREAEIMDPQHRVFLECAWEAMEHAGYGPGTPGASGRIGVYAGASMNTYLGEYIMRDAALVDAVGGFQLMLGNDKDFLCTRVSYKLNLRGPSMTIQSACSTSLVAVASACRALQRGECEMALAGGVSMFFPQRAGYRFQEGMILSPDGHCRPFDRNAAGTRIGAGAGIVVLKPLSTAIADRDTIHAVIRGIAVNNDAAAKIGYTAPGVDGQVDVISMAQGLAQVTPESIGYAETHGTGTPLGDPIEIAALKRVFGRTAALPGYCRLGALKASIGHLDVAAGVAGLIKAVLVLQHRELPPLVNFTAANPALELDGSPFSASAVVEPWDSTAPRRACVSSFGIGGTNAHAVLEEAPPLPGAVAGGVPYDEPELLVISARTKPALEAYAAALAEHLAGHPQHALADVAWTLRVGRPAFAHRHALVAASHDAAVTALRQPLRAPVLYAVHEGGERPVCFMFSGQGSQQLAMSSGLYSHEPVYREALDACADAFTPHLGLDIRKILFGVDEAALEDTAAAQPALFCVEHALASLWRHEGVEPTAMLGHSIGEYVACVLAGVMSLEDAARVIAARGRCMAAMPAGGMATVFAAAPRIVPHLPVSVEIAAFNGPSLCTIGGPTAALDETLRQLAAAGIDSRRLRTSHAFHTVAMDGALAPFTAVLTQVSLSPPKRPFISNVTGTWITPEQAVSPAYYAAHLRQPVQFAAGLKTLAAADPALLFLEVGPGQSLSRLARAALPPAQADLVAATLPAAGTPADDVRGMRVTTGRLWLAGVATVPATGRRGRVPLPTYPFQRIEHRAGSNTRRPVRQDDRGRVRTYAPTWMRDDTGPTLAVEGVWLVVGTPGAREHAVVTLLETAGAQVLTCLPGTPLAGALQGRAPQGIIVLNGLDPEAGTRGSGRRLYRALVQLVGELENVAAASTVRVFVATCGARSVLDEAVGDPEAVLVAGAAMTLSAELPWLTVRAVDLPAAAVDVQAVTLLREIRIATHAAEIAWRGGRRWCRRFDEIELPSHAPAVRNDGFHLITGGLGGIGLSLAAWLASCAAPVRLLLTGRRNLPPSADPEDPTLAPWARAAARTLRAIEAAGGQVLTAVADAADPAAMRTALAQATASFGPVRGVIHAAGTPGAGKLTLLQEDADVAATLAPKVDGLAVLLELLGATDLEFVALMSSINAVVPAPGVADYAAANMVLDAFAEGGNHPVGWRRVFAIDWSAWSGVGMAANLQVPAAQRAAHQALLRTAIAPAAAVELFGHILASAHSRVVVSSYDVGLALSSAFAPSVATGAQRTHVAPASDSALDKTTRPVLSTRYEPPLAGAETAIASIWTELMGVTGIGANDDFFELGGHSLLATRVLSRIGQTLGVQLSLRAFFDSPTLRGLGSRITAAAAENSASGVDGPAEREEFLL
jgi:acyl transferase domain-containing protein/NADP-dependent 3-hydroxy acid dehydrogenase YdfG